MPLATVMLALPCAFMVKVPVRVRPVVAVVTTTVPPVAVTSLLTKVVSGSSLKLKVMVAVVAPDLITCALLLTINVGFVVSALVPNSVAAVLRLPAASLKVPAATLIDLTTELLSVRPLVLLKVDVYCVLLTVVSVPRLPFATVISASAKSLEASLSVKVSVTPSFSGPLA